MKNRSSYAVLTRFGILGAILATLVFIAPAVFAADLERDYDENGTDPVQTFSATDADGDPIVWGLDGDDEDDFKIDGGVLTFASPPNYESPTDERADNIYKVTVTASGGSFSVEVTVKNVDEPGAPTLTKPQPQVDRGLVAEGPNDPDIPVTDVTWQWARSMDKVTWEDIGTPAGSGSRNPTEDDIDHYLRATAMYTDGFGTGKTASIVSENPVEPRTTANARPSFADHEDSDTTTDGIQIARSVDENAKGAQVGKPITAKDDDEVLVYTLTDPDTTDTTDVTELFGIGARTGQITTKAGIDSDADAADGSAEDTYTVTVNVIDPSGADASVTVVITINDVNDAPAFGATAPKELWVTENGTSLFTDAAVSAALGATAYAATDDDAADTTLTASVGGADGGKFSLTADGELTFDDHTPNYEGQKTYSITLMVEDDEFAQGTLDVTVNVLNAEDGGTVKLNAREPQIGKSVTATLSDPDGTIRGQEWQWGRVAETDVNAACPTDAASYTDIEGATSPTYNPAAEDENFCLFAEVTYTDGFVTDTDGTVGDDGDDASIQTERAVQASDPANAAPAFPKDNDPNEPGDQAVAEREVPENAEVTVGDAVVAEDADLLMYSVSDTDNFSVNNDGQISTKVKLDYESLPEDAKYHMVTLTAVDPSGASGSIMVKITVTDEDDAPVVTGTKSFEYPEGTTAVGTFSATDQDGDDIEWTLEGDDAGDFKITPSDDGASADLTFASAPNFESPADDRTDNLYKVTVAASGMAKGTLAVEVKITDVDEPGKPTLSKPQPQVGRPFEAEGPNDPDVPITDVTWQWSRSANADGPWEDIGNPTASGSRDPVAADEGMFLRATAMYTDKHGSGKTASKVSENPVEPRTLANAQPSFAGLDTDKDTDGIQVARTVDENVKDALVGDPIAASDDDDVLVYSLVDMSSATVGTDNSVDETSLFAINARSGQITTKVKLDSSSTTGLQDAVDDTGEAGGDGSNGGEVTHTVRVTVVDPSGASNSQDVTILVNDVNDAPAFDADNDPKTLWVVENTLVLTTDDAGATTLPTDAYAAADDDASDGDTDNPLDLLVGGADMGAFELSDTGALSFKSDHKVNYEGQKEYSITLMVEDNEFALGTYDVTVKVRNAEDAGSVSLNAREPQVGKQVLASLSDQDGPIRDQSWQWYRNAASDTAESDLVSATTACADDTTTLCPISGATSPAYTPAAADEGTDKGLLAARVTYSDSCVRGAADTPPICDGLADDESDLANSAFKVTERDVQIDDPANTAPKFGDQDPNTPGDQLIAEREVPENMKTTVGDAVVAEDTDLLMYSVDPDDNFSVDNEGQISTKVELDYEALPEDAKYYMVELTATDPSGASDSIMVKITVTDGPDTAIITLGGAAPAPDSECVTGGAVADASNGGLTSDCEILLAGMDELVGDGTALNWSADTPIVEWQGVSSEQGEGRVVSIYLKGHGLAGSIPAGFNGLDALTKLQLHSNDLTGEIPDLSDLDNLIWLILQNNSLSGSLPMTLGDMDSLDFLYLRDNDLSGDIPTELTHATDLRRVDLRDNALTGTIPTEFGHMTRLRYLMLSDNDLSGMIPADLGSSPNMVLIYLSDNGLTGEIPAELGNISGLKRLQLHDNMLDGDVPAELGNLSELTNLTLSGNMLMGCVPAAIYDALADAADTGLMACADDES